MSDKTQIPVLALIPIEEREVNFYGDSITAALVDVEDTQQIYVPIRPLCEYLGLDWSAQYRRLKRDVVLSESLNSVAIMATQLPGVGKGRRELLCLPLELIPGWLFGIEATRIKVEQRDKIVRYQRECFKVLWEAFQADALNVSDRVGFEAGALPNESTTPNSTLMQIREMALAVAQLAEQQMVLEKKVDKTSTLALTAHERLDKAALVVKELKERLGLVERKVAPQTLVSDDQATEIMLAVKALAEHLGQHEPGKNYYQGVYQELYRRFGVHSYKSIRTEQLQSVMQFLEDWRKNITVPTSSTASDSNSE